jgi:hypothetical protein
MKKLPGILAEDSFLQFDVQDRDYGELSDEIGAQLSRDFSFTGDFLDGAFNRHLTEGGIEAEGVREFYEAGAAADPRQNLGFNVDLNAALLADERFAGFDEDFGGGRFGAYLDNNNLRDAFDDFMYAREHGDVEPDENP